MKKFLFLFLSSLCLLGCNKMDYLTARYKFIVQGDESKAALVDPENIKIKFEAGDRINITVGVFDSGQGNRRSGGVLLYDPCQAEYKCDLVFDGANWSIDKDGRKIEALEVTGKDGSYVNINYLITNGTEDTVGFFRVNGRRRIDLKSGDQTIAIDFSKPSEAIV